MSKKENFNKAMYDMFGVGSDPDAAAPVEEAPAVEEAAPAAQPVAPAEPARVPAASAAITYLAPGTKMEGTLTAKGDVEVAGEFKGNIQADGSVVLHTGIVGNITAASLTLISCTLTGNAYVSGPCTVDAASSVEGDIQAEDLICSGNIKGDLTISANTTLKNTAAVSGSISTGTIVMERGAVVSGELRMGK